MQFGSIMFFIFKTKPNHPIRLGLTYFLRDDM